MAQGTVFASGLSGPSSRADGSVDVSDAIVWRTSSNWTDVECPIAQPNLVELSNRLAGLVLETRSKGAPDASHAPASGRAAAASGIACAETTAGAVASSTIETAAVLADW